MTYNASCSSSKAESKSLDLAGGLGVSDEGEDLVRKENELEVKVNVKIKVKRSSLGVQMRRVQ